MDAVKDPGLDRELGGALQEPERALCIYCLVYEAADDNEYCSASCAAMAERENEEDR